MMMNKKILIAYFSRKGQNHVSGKVINLSIGNTEVIAKKILAFIGGDLFEIKPVKPYPSEYTETIEITKAELRQKVQPEILETVKNMADYDVVYLGYPNWWNTFPMVVYTFLESYDFSGKTIIPFCTHEGSGMGNSERDIKQLCPNAKVLEGIVIRGSLVKSADRTVRSWLKNHKTKVGSS